MAPGRHVDVLVALLALSATPGARGWALSSHPAPRRVSPSPTAARLVCKQSTTQAGKQVADNRIARSRYEIVEKVEAGISLTGTEVKSCRAGNVNLRDGFARISGSDIWLENVHISKHSSSGAYFQHEEKRARRLLLHKRQISKLRQSCEQKGFTLVPLRCYFNQGNLLKVELGLARGLKNYDKRAQLKERVVKREVQRELKNIVNR